MFCPFLVFSFRREGLAAAEASAKVFGWEGAQFPWCAVSFGRSAGCCDGHGGEELCLEQHITPDVGFAMQQYVARVVCP